MSSMAFGVARSCNTIPVLVVKANSAGRWNSPNAGNVNQLARDYLTVMAHLDSTAVGG